MTVPTQRILLVDLENCPSQINQLMNNLEQYQQIVICYAHTSAKIPIDWLLTLNSVINEERLKLVKMPIIGKNSADFGMAFWAGLLSAQLPKATHFDIISNDTDLDYVVLLLQSQDYLAERIGIRKEIILNNAVESNDKSHTLLHNLMIDYCHFLIEINNNKPTKKESILNSISSKFRNQNIDPNKILEKLIAEKIIIITDNKVSYNQQKLNQFSI